MALTFLGSTSIPLLETMNHNNFLEVTPNAYLEGLSRSLYLCKMLNTSSRAWI